MLRQNPLGESFVGIGHLRYIKGEHPHIACGTSEQQYMRTELRTCHRWMFLWCKAMLFSRSSLLLPCLLSRNSSSSPLLSIWYNLSGGEDEMSCSPALTFSPAWRDEVKELDLGLWPELRLSEFRDSTCLPPAFIHPWYIMQTILFRSHQFILWLILPFLGYSQPSMLGVFLSVLRRVT